MKLWTKYKIFIHENASEIIVCEMAVILSKERWIDTSDVVKINQFKTMWYFTLSIKRHLLLKQQDRKNQKESTDKALHSCYLNLDLNLHMIDRFTGQEIVECTLKQWGRGRTVFKSVYRVSSRKHVWNIWHKGRRRGVLLTMEAVRAIILGTNLMQLYLLCWSLVELPHTILPSFVNET